MRVVFRVAHAACVVTLLRSHKDIPVIVNDCLGVQSMIVMDYPPMLRPVCYRAQSWPFSTIVYQASKNVWVLCLFLHLCFG